LVIGEEGSLGVPRGAFWNRAHGASTVSAAGKAGIRTIMHVFITALLPLAKPDIDELPGAWPIHCAYIVAERLRATSDEQRFVATNY
jgi:hypothetical protein